MQRRQCDASLTCQTRVRPLDTPRCRDSPCSAVSLTDYLLLLTLLKFCLSPFKKISVYILRSQTPTDGRSSGRKPKASPYNVACTVWLSFHQSTETVFLEEFTFSISCNVYRKSSNKPSSVVSTPFCRKKFIKLLRPFPFFTQPKQQTADSTNIFQDNLTLPKSTGKCWLERDLNSHLRDTCASWNPARVNIF